MLVKYDVEQLVGQLTRQEEFLELIYPGIMDNGYKKECVEIRAIRRDKNISIKSLNIWRFDDEGVENHLKFLDKVNGKPVCLYYSGFCYDYDKKVIKKDGKPYIKGKINNENAVFTQILPMDFDNINEEEHEKILKQFKNLNIEVLSVFTGHGFQDIILLSEKYYDKNIFKKFTYLLKAKGFDVDEAIIDPARVLRLPFTWNCKAYDKKSKYYNSNNPEAIFCKIVKTPSKRYNISDIFNVLEKLDTKNQEYYNLYNKVKNGDSDKKILDLIKIEKELNSDVFVSIEKEYSMINFQTLPEAVQSMLKETPENYRNSVLMFLIPFFRNTLGLRLEKIIDILKIWAKHCKPKLDEDFIINEVKRIYSYNNLGSGKYSGELARKFGKIEFEDYSEYTISNKIRVSNEFIENYNKLSDGSVRIYLMMKLFEKTDNIKEWTIDDFVKYCKISKNTFNRNIVDLLEFGFVDKKRNAKSLNEKYKYYLNKYENESLGFTLFNCSTIRMMAYDPILKLNNAEIKLYTYICKMINNNKTETCFASQEYLSERIGKKRNTLVKLTNSLNDKKYLKKDKFLGNDMKEHCIYTLIF